MTQANEAYNTILRLQDEEQTEFVKRLIEQAIFLFKTMFPNEQKLISCINEKK